MYQLTKYDRQMLEVTKCWSVEQLVSTGRVVVVIPVYNEAEVVVDVIDEVSRAGNYLLVVVDDGSHDETYQRICQKDVVAIRHKINRGKGAAVKTGITAACRLNGDIVVTMDGDGQHDPLDIPQLIQPILEEGYDVVLGSRLINHTGMPLMKVIANRIGNLCTWLFYGLLVTDSQSGFRAYSRFAAMIIDTKADKYEYDSKVLREIKNNRLKYIEVPIKVRYTDYSRNKPQKQGMINGLKTVWRMIWDLVA